MKKFFKWLTTLFIFGLIWLLIIGCIVSPQTNSSPTPTLTIITTPTPTPFPTPLLPPWQGFTDPNFFPIFVWYQPYYCATAYKAAGVNLYISPVIVTEKQLSGITAAGIKVICEQNRLGLYHINDPNIIGWMQRDEPDCAQWDQTKNDWGPPIQPDVIVAEYNRMKSIDPSRPIFLNLNMGVADTDWFGRGSDTGRIDKYPDYISGCDIVSFDIYPVSSTVNDVHHNLWLVAQGIDNLGTWSNGSNKPRWCWIECTKINAGCEKATPEEVKAEVWMALVHGATGYGYFPFDFTIGDAAVLQDPPMLAAITTINQQVTSLAPVLNSTTTTGYASVSSSNGNVPIDIITKNHDGYNYIFALAMRPEASTGTFTVASGSTVEVLGESRNININSGQFSDNFAPYGVHLYKIAEL